MGVARLYLGPGRTLALDGPVRDKETLVRELEYLVFVFNLVPRMQKYRDHLAKIYRVILRQVKEMNEKGISVFAQSMGSATLGTSLHEYIVYVDRTDSKLRVLRIVV